MRVAWTDTRNYKRIKYLHIFNDTCFIPLFQKINFEFQST